MSEEVINAKITADTSQAEQSFRTIRRNIQDLGKDSSETAMSTKTAWQEAAAAIGSSWAKMATSFAAGNIITKALDAVMEKLAMIRDAVKDSILMAARYETLGVVMKVVGANAGYTASQMAAFQKGLQQTGISAVEARQGLMLMGQANVDMANSAKLARIAQDAAVIGNINSSEAFNRMMTGLATGQSILMHHLGLMTNFETAYLNAAHAAGKTTNDLTEVEKAQIRVNEVIRAGVGISGSYESAMSTAGKQLNSMKRYTNDLMVQFGAMFQGAFTAGVTALADSLKYVSANFEGIKVGAMGAASVLAGAAMYAATPLMVSLAGAVGTVLMAVNGFAYALITADGAAIAATFSFNALKVAMASNPLGLVIAALTTAVGLWMTYIKVQSNAIDKNAPKDNPVLVTLREEVSLLQSKIDLIKKSKGMETVSDPQVLELKRLEMQKQFIKDQDGGSGANFRVTATEMERKNIEKLIPQVAALKKEYANLTKEKEKPKTNIDAINEAAEQYNKLKTALEGYAIKAEKSGKVTNELAAFNSALRLETDQLFESTLKAKNTDPSSMAADDIKKQIELYRQVIEANHKLSDHRKGAAIERKALLHSELETVKNTQAETLASIELQESSHTITALEGMKLRQEAMKGEAEKNKEILQNALAEAQSKVTGLDNLTGKDTIDKKSSQYKEALVQVTQAQSALDTATSKSNQTLTANAAATAKATEAARDYAISVRNEIAALNAKNSATTASMVGTNSWGGFDTVADQTANQMAILEDAHKRELEMIEEKRKAVMVLALDKGIVASGAVQKIIALENEERLAKEKNTKAVTKIGLDSYKAQLSAASQYTNLAGNFFTSLASTQDQTSRDGFETAKAFNTAAAVMSTASAIMNALATVQPYPLAVATAGIAAATGAIQIAKIQSTSFGGGGSVSAPSGSFGAGGASGSGSTAGIGSAVGNRYVSTKDSLSGDKLDAIAVSMGNAALSMGSAAASLDQITSSMKSSIVAGAVGSAPNKYTNIQGADSIWKQIYTKTALSATVNLTKDTLAIFKGDLVTTLMAPINYVKNLGASMYSSLFGGSWNTTGSGITLGMSGGNVSGSQYTTSHKSGGLFTSSKDKTDYSAIDQGFIDTLNTAKTEVVASIRDNAISLGVSGAAFDATVKSTNIAQTAIATAGRTTEEISKDITAQFTKMANVISENAIPRLKEFAISSSETATEVTDRLAGAIRDTNSQFALLGLTLFQSSLEGANAAYKLQDLMGGTEQFAKVIDKYFTSMFTDVQQSALKAAKATNEVVTTFAQAQIAVPKTKAQFIALVNSLDTSDEAGARAFDSLMSVSEAFATMIDQADKLKEAQKSLTDDANVRILRLTPGQSGTADLLELQIAQQKEIKDALDKGLNTGRLVIAQQMEWAAAVKKASTVVSEATQKMIDSTKKALTTSITSTLGILKTLQGILTNKDNLSPEAAYTAAKDRFNSADATNVSETATALLDASKNYNASGAAYQADYQAVITKLADMGGTKATISDVDRQIAYLTKIETAINTGNSDMLAALTGTLTATKINLGTASNEITIAMTALQDALNGKDTAGKVLLGPGTAKEDLTLEMAALQAVLDGTDATGKKLITDPAAVQLITSAIDALQLSLNGTIDTTTAVSIMSGVFTTVQGALNHTVDTTVAEQTISGVFTSLQTALRGTLDTSVAVASIRSMFTVIEGSIGGTISPALALATINTLYRNVEGNISGYISPALALNTVSALYSTIAGAIGGTISPALALSAVNTLYRNVEGSIGGYISPTMAISTLNTLYAAIAGAIAGTISPALALKTVDTLYRNVEGNLSGYISPVQAIVTVGNLYNAISGSIGGTISPAEALATVSNLYNSIAGSMSGSISPALAIATVQSLYSSISGAIGGSINTSSAVSTIGNALDSVGTALTTGVTKLGTTIGALVTAFQNAIATPAATAVTPPASNLVTTPVTTTPAATTLDPQLQQNLDILKKVPTILEAANAAHVNTATGTADDNLRAYFMGINSDIATLWASASYMKNTGNLGLVTSIQKTGVNAIDDLLKLAYPSYMTGGAMNYGSYVAGITRFATGGDHFGGLRIVGENGPELEATGSARIYNANQTRQIMQKGTADNKGVEERLDKMIAALDAMSKRLASLETKARLVSNA
jgi:hypothetical protein